MKKHKPITVEKQVWVSMRQRCKPPPPGTGGQREEPEDRRPFTPAVRPWCDPRGRAAGAQQPSQAASTLL